MKPRYCTCEKCVSACKRRPGWFAPGEVEKAAALLGVPFADFRKRLIREFWVGDKSTGYEDVDCLSPRMVGVDDGEERASYESAFYPGRCVFLTEEDRCEIHAAKPKECRLAMPCESGRASESRHNRVKAGIVRSWRAIGGAK